MSNLLNYIPVILLEEIVHLLILRISPVSYRMHLFPTGGDHRGPWSRRSNASRVSEIILTKSPSQAALDALEESRCLDWILSTNCWVKVQHVQLFLGFRWCFWIFVSKELPLFREFVVDFVQSCFCFQVFLCCEKWCEWVHGQMTWLVASMLWWVCQWPAHLKT